MTLHHIFDGDAPFFVGCNYWASHAGTAMWRNWSAETVADDFRLLAANGMEVVRVFPLWPDFQPITAHTGGHQHFVEMRLGEEPLPDEGPGAAGVAPVMLERLRVMCKLAREHRLKLVVALVTGWMSGRMHVPPAFEKVNVLTDPAAIMWQTRLVRCLVDAVKEEDAVIAWDLGNECNSMADAGSREAAWLWTKSIAAAIRLADNTRPIVSGMHSLSCQHDHWRIVDQGELTDVLCTHPYPLFTPHCNLDPVNTMRNAFHAAAETRLYADVGRVAAFVEEAGSLGPCQSAETVAAGYLNNMLWNTYAHDCRGLLWWCAHDQKHLPQSPYDWLAVERELGLLRSDRSAKPALTVMQNFAAMLDQLDLRRLPDFRRDAVCLLSLDQDQWGAGYASFILAKQAGFDIEFQLADQPLKPSTLYLLPSIRDCRVLPARRYRELLQKVAAGATLLVCSDGGCLEPFNEVFGIDILWQCRAVNPLVINAVNGDYRVSCRGERQLKLAARTAQVLARDADGDPVFTAQFYGNGQLLFAAAPVELAASLTPRSFMPEGPELFQIYRSAMQLAKIERCVCRSNPSLTLSEHRLDEQTMLLVAVNNTPSAITDALVSDWVPEAVLHGQPPAEGNRFTVPGNDGIIVRYHRR